MLMESHQKINKMSKNQIFWLILGVTRQNLHFLTAFLCPISLLSWILKSKLKKLFENPKSHVRISACDNKQTWPLKEGKCIFSDLNWVKMAEFRLLQVGAIGK